MGWWGSVPARFWQGFQLAMTRALGHKLLGEYGVIATPSVAIRTLQPEDVCLILASDGIWEVRAGGSPAGNVACTA